MESISPPAASDLTPLATQLSAPVIGGPYDDPWSLKTTETRGPVAPGSPDPDELGRHEERREQDATNHQLTQKSFINWRHTRHSISVGFHEGDDSMSMTTSLKASCGLAST